MDGQTKVEVTYFTDVLCVWAYVAQIRIDRLQQTFGDRIRFEDHFIPVFGSVNSLLEKNWAPKGGLDAYSEHVKSIGRKFDHIEINPAIWTSNIPASSSNCHLFLKAVQLLSLRGELAEHAGENSAQKNIFEQAVWEIRLAFFRDLVDVSSADSQMGIAERLGLPLMKIEALLKNGEAFAALHDDFQLKEKFRITGSPTLLFNEGRQMIYGNVGYRVIEANMQELLNQPDSQASWC